MILNEEQQLIRDMAREFADNELKPIAGEIDRNHTFPLESVKRMGELGVLGLGIPEKYEGPGGDAISYAVAMEEISRVSAAHGAILGAHNSLCLGPLMQYGTEDQKASYIADLAVGRKIGAFCLTESGAGTDAAAQQTVAERRGDTYVLNGSKVFITNGGYAETFVVFAMTDKSQGVRGISAFIVEKDFPGFAVGQSEDKLGIRASSTTEILFKDCEVPASNLLGREGEGFRIAMTTLDSGRIGIAAQAVGIAQASLDAAVAYSRERIQFGRPISSNQGIQWMLADMAARTEAARALTFLACEYKQAGKRFSKQASMAKLVAAEAAMWVSTKAVQILGGIGYTSSWPVERFMRDAKITEIYEGTNEVQRMVIAGSLLA